MNGRPDNQMLTTFGKFLRAHQQVSEALNRDLTEQRGISLSWYDVLLQISSAPEGRLRLQDLADRVLYSRSGLTRLIDRMEAAGLVTRQPCSQDKRGTYAAMTPEGKRVFKRAAAVHLRGIEDHFFAYLSEQEIAAMRQAMDHVLRGMKRANGAAATAVPAEQ